MQLPHTLTLAGAGAALDALRAAIPENGAGAVVIDASALKVFDTAALALLLQVRRLAGSRGWRVNGASPQLTQLAQLYGVAELLGLQLERAAGP